MTNPKISIIIPVYNTAIYLRACLNSIISQTLRDIEIICVDDGSTDESLRILYKYATIDKRIKVLTQDNKYAGVARNYGMTVAKGEYYLFLDSDDFFELDMLEKAYEQIVKHEADICVFGSDIYDEALQCFRPAPYTCVEEKVPQNVVFSRKTNNKNIYCFTTPSAWTKLFRRTFVEKYQLCFQEIRSANDMRFVFLAIGLAERIITLPEIFVHYRRNRGGSLQSSQERDPLSFYKALVGLRDGLNHYGIYSEMEAPFKNYALNSSLYNLSTLHNPEAFEYLYLFLRNSGFYELDINEHEEKYWYAYIGNKLFQKREDIKTLTPVEYAKKYNLMLNKDSENIEKKLKITEKKLKSSLLREISLKNSISFRIGRVITWMPRKLRDGLRAYNQ